MAEHFTANVGSSPDRGSDSLAVLVSSYRLHVLGDFFPGFLSEGSGILFHMQFDYTLFTF